MLAQVHASKGEITILKCVNNLLKRCINRVFYASINRCLIIGEHDKYNS